jgi:hypothetical protein
MDSTLRRMFDELNGKRIRCIEVMPDPITGKPDPNPIKSGEEGTIFGISYNYVNDMGTIQISWDNGRTLGLLMDFDKYVIL